MSRPIIRPPYSYRLIPSLPARSAGRTLPLSLDVVVLAIGARMDLEKIKELIDVLAASDLAEIELVEGEHRVRLVKRLRAEAGAGLSATPAAAAVAARAASEPDARAQATHQEHSDTEAAEWVTAPLYGVVHLTPSPDAAAFVQLGDLVQTGQTLCVIEAMKMFHEVKASRKGRIEVILAAAGEEAEAGAALFQLKAV